jgi:hypothetical protein
MGQRIRGISAFVGARLWRAALLSAALFSSPAFSQSPSDVKVTGSVTGKFPDGGGIEATFSCTGSPTCRGTYSAVIRDTLCSNPFIISDAIVVTGLDLSRPGTNAGSVTFANIDYSDIPHPDGSCSVRPNSSRPRTMPYTGTWDGSTGTFVATTQDDLGRTILLNGTFKADIAPPVFPMVVTASIDAVQATARADIQFRPQDVGSSGSVYVFAVAPVTLIKGAIPKGAHYGGMSKGGPKDTAPVQCVLAQLTSSGQLAAVSASSLLAYTTGLLSAQGQTVQILNGVATVNIGGATFYVGYGSSATAMINSGVNRSAVTVPGSQVCKPQPPQTGWWWNPAEDGRGFSVEVRGNNIFFAAFLYDVTGRSTWYVATGPVSLDGSLYTGPLYSAKGGQTLGGAYFGGPTLKDEGPITLAFNSATTGTMVWPGGTVPIQRFNIVQNGLNLPPAVNQPESGWWWNDQESGRGFFMEWQAGTLDIAGYMYDDAGNSVWYLTVDSMKGATGQTFTQNWWSYGNGQTLTGAWKPNTPLSTTVAPLSIQFSAPDTAIMTLPNGRTTALKRHRF